MLKNYTLRAKSCFQHLRTLSPNVNNLQYPDSQEESMVSSRGESNTSSGSPHSSIFSHQERPFSKSSQRNQDTKKNASVSPFFSVLLQDTLFSTCASPRSAPVSARSPGRSNAPCRLGSVFQWVAAHTGPRWRGVRRTDERQRCEGGTSHRVLPKAASKRTVMEQRRERRRT